MTADENLKILKKILDGIANNNIDEVMLSLNFELSKESDKSKEWIMKLQ